VSSGDRSSSVVLAATSELLNDGERALLRCRRRGESASVLVVRLDPRFDFDPKQLVAALRMTDSAAFVHSRRSGYELLAVLEDDTRLERKVVEQRLRSLVQGGRSLFGWARFPQEGLTLDVLVERARAAATVARSAQELRPGHPPLRRRWHRAVGRSESSRSGPASKARRRRTGNDW
jgi:hypothetical protein